jgi:hypothetical protein
MCTQTYLISSIQSKYSLQEHFQCVWLCFLRYVSRHELKSIESVWDNGHQDNYQSTLDKMWIHSTVLTVCLF